MATKDARRRAGAYSKGHAAGLTENKIAIAVLSRRVDRLEFLAAAALDGRPEPDDQAGGSKTKSSGGAADG